MSELISGKDALTALRDGKKVEARNQLTGMDWSDARLLNVFCFDEDMFEFRLKTNTIKIEIEIPAPFEPKDGEDYWTLDTEKECGYSKGGNINHESLQFGAWRTELEVKQVVQQLRKIREDAQ
jgi:hypothetical protein